MTVNDSVNHPQHYTSHPSGVECIEVVEHMGFNLGNAIKYIWRADEKGNATEDLEKAAWYIQRELARRHNFDSHVEVFNQTEALPSGVRVSRWTTSETVSPREAVADFREGLRIVKRNDHAESGFTVTPFDKLLSNMGKKLDAHVGVAAVPNELGVWVGDNRCGDAIVHPAHGYDRDTRGDGISGSHYAMWCDGYREVHSEPGA